MITAYKKFWINIFNFKGRSTRSDYWYVVLVNLLISFVIGIIADVISKPELLSIIYIIVTFILGISLSVRRYHDINKSGWNYLWIFVPIVGYIIMIVYLCTPSVNENNKYGERA